MLSLVQIQIWLEPPAAFILDSKPNVAATNCTIKSSLQITHPAGIIILLNLNELIVWKVG